MQLNLIRKFKDIYGNLNFEEYLDSLYEEFDDIEINYYQSNIEGEIINKLHEVDIVNEIKKM